MENLTQIYIFTLPRDFLNIKSDYFEIVLKTAVPDILREHSGNVRGAFFF